MRISSRSRILRDKSVQLEQEAVRRAEQSEKTHSVKGTGKGRLQSFPVRCFLTERSLRLRGGGCFPGDDNNLYLLAMKTYEDAVPEDAVPIARGRKENVFYAEGGYPG